MKFTYIYYTILLSISIGSCSLNDEAGLNKNSEEVVEGFDGTFIQEDRVGRPAINTALVSGARKEVFNLTLTEDLQEEFKDEMEAFLLRISPAYNSSLDVNALGQTASNLASLLANDVLNVNLEGQTTFFDPNTGKVLTGRALEDDVMDTELILIFGGEDGMENPTLNTDFVEGNDRGFKSSFPYLPRPW